MRPWAISAAIKHIVKNPRGLCMCRHWGMTGLCTYTCRYIAVFCWLIWSTARWGFVYCVRDHIRVCIACKDKHRVLKLIWWIFLVLMGTLRLLAIIMGMIIWDLRKLTSWIRLNWLVGAYGANLSNCKKSTASFERWGWIWGICGTQLYVWLHSFCASFKVSVQVITEVSTPFKSAQRPHWVVLYLNLETARHPRAGELRTAALSLLVSKYPHCFMLWFNDLNFCKLLLPVKCLRQTVQGPPIVRIHCQICSVDLQRCSNSSSGTKGWRCILLLLQGLCSAVHSTCMGDQFL